LDDYGYVLEMSATAGKLKLHDGTGKVMGIAYKSTKNPVTLVATAAQKVGIVRHGQAWVKCDATHAAMVVGDTICAEAGGFGNVQTVTDNMTWAERCLRIGTALSALALNTAGYVLVDLNLAE
jgi:hypothetical protein